VWRKIAKSGKWQEFGKVRFRSIFHFWAARELTEKRHEKGSSGRTRTYNPPVNSRMLCHWATEEQWHGRRGFRRRDRKNLTERERRGQWLLDMTQSHREPA